MTVASGSRLGPYEVLSPLGAGGMGEVWRARDTRLSREVAIKVLPADVAGDASRLKRFEKEARSASALNHPNIVTIYDIGTTDSVSWMAMELVGGRTLRELLVDGALPVKRLLQIAPQIADGLAKAHEAGIVHRDLKPENVMLTKDGLVKILDFGLAKLTQIGSGSGEGSQLPTETGTSPGVVLGTIGYMSPEQASAQPVDFRSDQFSFGSILYEMATGKRAFQKKTAVDTLSAILHEEPMPVAEINPQAPAPLRWIVERCLAKDPEGRYASTKDLARDLASIRDHLSEALPVGIVASASARTGGALWLALAAGALAAAALFAGAGLLIKQGRSGSPSSGPRFEQVTFGLQNIFDARFGLDDDSVVYSATVAGAPIQLFLARRGGAESRPQGIARATIASVSPSGEMAVLRTTVPRRGTLAVASLAGGAPRDILEDVRCASWGRDGRSLAVVHVVEGKDRLEFPIGKVLLERAGSQAPSGESIHGCAVSRDGSLIAAAVSKDLAVVDLAGKVTRIAPYVPGTDFAWSPTGDELWYTDYGTGGITELYGITLKGRKRLLASLPGDFVLMAVSGKGRVLLERETGELRVLGRLFGDGEERDLAWLEGSYPVCIGQGGRTFLFDVTRPGASTATAVYLKKSDGSSPVRLTTGWSRALSPDGKWVITMRNLVAPPIVLTPTGAGAERSLPDGGLTSIGWSNWLPDGERILFAASAPGEKSRLYLQDVLGGPPRAISPEGYRLGLGVTFVSPDGHLVFARDEQGRAVLFPTQGVASQPPRLITGLSADEEPVQWSADGKRLFIREGGKSFAISLLDPVSGQRRRWKTFPPPDPSLNLTRFLLTPDGESWVGGYQRWTSNLFLLEGVK